MQKIMIQEDFEIHIVLDKPLIAHLSSLKENLPCSSPLWFLYDEKKLWLFGTDKDSFIQRLYAHSSCAISVVDFDLTLGIMKHVGIRGIAKVTEIDKDKLDKFLCKYLGNNKSKWNEWFVDNIVIPLNRMVIIQANSIVAKDVSYFKSKI